MLREGVGIAQPQARKGFQVEALCRAQPPHEVVGGVGEEFQAVPAPGVIVLALGHGTAPVVVEAERRAPAPRGGHLLADCHEEATRQGSGSHLAPMEILVGRLVDTAKELCVPKGGRLVLPCLLCLPGEGQREGEEEGYYN